jgi:hypothetical protein
VATGVEGPLSQRKWRGSYRGVSTRTAKCGPRSLNMTDLLQVVARPSARDGKHLGLNFMMRVSRLLRSLYGLYQGTTFSRAEPVPKRLGALAPARESNFSGAEARVLLRTHCGTAEAMP